MAPSLKHWTKTRGSASVLGRNVYLEFTSRGVWIHPGEIWAESQIEGAKVALHLAEGLRHRIERDFGTVLGDFELKGAEFAYPNHAAARAALAAGMAVGPFKRISPNIWIDRSKGLELETDNYSVATAIETHPFSKGTDIRDWLARVERAGAGEVESSTQVPLAAKASPVLKRSEAILGPQAWALVRESMLAALPAVFT